jgi:hypothetical protein
MRPNDMIQVALGVVLGISLFLPWYGTDASNPSSNVDGKRGELGAWIVHPVLRWVLLAGAVATLLGAWQTMRAQRAELPRGQITVMLAVLVAGLIVMVGLIIRPGSPPATISLEYGWFVALAAPLGAIATGLTRQPRARRAPPGVTR